MTNETLVTFSLRLPTALHRKMARKAKRNRRSLNNEIVVAVRRYLIIIDVELVDGQPDPVSGEVTA